MKHIEYVLYCWLEVENVKIARLIFFRIDGLAFGHPTKYLIVHVLGFWVVVKRRYNDLKVTPDLKEFGISISEKLFLSKALNCSNVYRKILVI